MDSAEEKIRRAERETVAVALGHRKGDDPLRTPRDVAETLDSPNFETAVSDVREKIHVAVEWHLKMTQNSMGMKFFHRL